MSESKNLFFLGYSGHAYVVLDVALANNYNIQGYFDNKEAAFNPYKLPYLGDECTIDITSIIENGCIFPAMGSNSIRKKLITFVKDYGLNQIELIDPSAWVSPKACIGSSSVVAPNAIVNSLAEVGDGCIINSGAVIEHECKVGNFSHIAPGAVLAGNIVLGSLTFVGANAVIKQGITVGDNVTIGAGSVVLKDIPNGEVWVGNPAKRIK
ncbi:acetyltransferase [Kriegella aquimaris]|uniref:Transferase hexapeptide (Six repeat-containing protein) n=1 Tax=Kriegella aquimaris TaxID=192904 RepID=A0A1G9QIG7_9FLAO|nr:acetyltransferase [Kriegella aquimaris]SDM10297.1 transferase hexapeptide (six repeat-containing protein) [Kriegella aquimaris]